MKWKCLLAMGYGLLTVWTGVLRSVEAKAFKPNAFFFCLVMGLAAVAGGYLLRLGWRWTGTLAVLFSAGVVLAFYLSCFIGAPEKDATLRVGIIITGSIGTLVFLFLPPARRSAPAGNELAQDRGNS